MPGAAEDVARIHRWFVEYLDGDAVVGRVPVDPEWGPAVESARLAGIRRGLLPAVTSGGRWTIEPRWHDATGAPWVASAVATLRVGEAAVSAPIPFAYFADAARSGLSALVAAGWRGSGTVRYLVGAEPPDGSAPPPGTAASALVVEERPTSLGLGSGRLADLVSGPLPAPDHEDDLPVVIAPAVIEAMRRRAEADRTVETGGFLLGRLHRDASRDDLFLAITELVPAEHTDATRGRLTFTPETWWALHDRLDERDDATLVVGGWAHVHPFQCRDCPPERRAACPFAHPVFSADDVVLHRACFAAPWSVALLLSERDTGSYDVTLFGWHHGLVAERRFHLAGQRPAQLVGPDGPADERIADATT